MSHGEAPVGSKQCMHTTSAGTSAGSAALELSLGGRNRGHGTRGQEKGVEGPRGKRPNGGRGGGSGHGVVYSTQMQRQERHRGGVRAGDAGGVGTECSSVSSRL